MKKQLSTKIKRMFGGEGYGSALLRMLPIVLMAGIVPLIVRQYSYETGLVGQPWFSFEAIGYEFFLAPKALVLTILFFVMAIVIGFSYRKRKKKVPLLRLLIPLVAYLALALLSAIFSINKSFSFFGSYEQFESIFVLFSYGSAVFYCYLFAKSALERQVIVDSIGFCATTVGLIGVFQGLGMDLLKTTFVQKLMTTEDFLVANGGKLDMTFGEGRAYGTLYNTNYMGVFGSFLAPFFATLLLLEKNKWRRIWHLLNMAIVTAAMLFSGSRAGLVSVGVSLLLLLIICIRSILKWWYLSIPAINLVIAMFLLVNNYTDNLIFTRIADALAPKTTQVEEIQAEDGTIIRQTGLTELYTTKDGVAICYNEIHAVISVYNEDGYFAIYAVDENGDQLPMNGTNIEENWVFAFEHPALADVTVEPIMVGEVLGMQLNAKGERVFWPDEEGYLGFNALGKSTDMIMAESAVFKKNLDGMSGRLYIWSRSIPLLKKHIFLGSGPDTFVLEFPQKDYLMMAKHGFEKRIMTKPHSMYLQVGIQTGVLSLVCLLTFLFWYIVQCLRLYCFRPLKTQNDAIGVAALIGTVGYMISQIANDSMVVTAPIFFVMVGVGIAANAAKMAEEK